MFFITVIIIIIIIIYCQYEHRWPKLYEFNPFNIEMSTINNLSVMVYLNCILFIQIWGKLNLL